LPLTFALWALWIWLFRLIVTVTALLIKGLALGFGQFILGNEMRDACPS
jgi:hypothetical protein